METNPVSEVSCFLVSRIPDNGKSPPPPKNSNFECYTPSSEPVRKKFIGCFVAVDYI
jgi:hypothetical protein